MKPFSSRSTKPASHSVRGSAPMVVGGARKSSRPWSAIISATGPAASRSVSSAPRLVAGRDDVVVGPEAAAQVPATASPSAEHQKDRPHVIASGGGYGGGQGIIVRQGAVNVDPS
jgi:hypothetical protein